MHNALCIMKETDTHHTEKRTDTATKRTYFYEHQYDATSRLHCIPKRFCHTAQEVDAFVRHNNLRATSFVARHNDGSVLHTGTHEHMRLWVVKQIRPVWVEPCMISVRICQELQGLRLVFAPGNTPVLYRRTLQHTRGGHSAQSVVSFPYHTQSVIIATDNAHQTYKEACVFLDQNRAKLPVSGYIDMCSIETHTGCYYITDVQELNSS